MLVDIIEDWQIIDDTQDIYVISDRGRVGKKIGNEVQIIIDIDDEDKANKRYKTVWLFGRKYYVHRLVAEYFLPKPQQDSLNQVHHKDHDNKHNCVLNLEWTTISYNNKLRTWDKKYKFDWESLRWTSKTLA